MRRSLRKCLVTGILLLACASCKPREAGEARAPATATSGPAATMPTTAPGTATFDIGGAIAFRSPAISLDHSGTPAQLILYSDNDSATGSFYFEVPIEGEWAVGSVVAWEEQLHPTADEESLVGIHLPGRTLLPVSMRITVRRLGATVAQVDITGEFAIHMEDAPALGPSTEVTASFLAAVED